MKKQYFLGMATTQKVVSFIWEEIGVPGENYQTAAIHW